MSAKEAAKAEAQEGTVTFIYDTTTYTVAGDALDDCETMLLFEDGKILATVRAVLGAAQWAQFVSKKRSLSVDLNDLTVAMFEALGTSSGE